MSKNKQLSKFFIAFFLITALPVVVSIVFRKDSVDPTTEASAPKDPFENIESAPHIINLPPTTAYVGQEYNFKVQIADVDTKEENLKLRIIEGPSWLRAEGLYVMGTPQESDLGVNKLQIGVSDGLFETNKLYYLVVKLD